MRKAFLLTGLILGCMSPAVASGPLPAPAPLVNGPPAAIPPPARDRAFIRLRSELRDLRRIGLALRESDGGTLTREHRDFIQARIDDAFAAYRRHHSPR
ncbi:MAG TPA: hypothetical protein VGW40_10850 [Allosphingosinicella sp.]|nr:hypothetical protein [Allosphingosinicella sp.]